MVVENIPADLAHNFAIEWELTCEYCSQPIDPELYEHYEDRVYLGDGTIDDIFYVHINCHNKGMKEHFDER